MDMNDVEWNTICRVCLQEGEMTSIHVKDDQNMTIKDKIIMCSSIEVSPMSFCIIFRNNKFIRNC